VAKTCAEWLALMELHLAKIQELGFGKNLVDSFEHEWKSLEADGFDVYAIYTGLAGTSNEGLKACIICSKDSANLQWKKVITPSMDSAAIYSVCQDCDSQYVEVALRQKALGRLLKERNTRPN
jgi:hypothetical protein